MPNDLQHGADFERAREWLCDAGIARACLNDPKSSASNCGEEIPPRVARVDIA